MGGRGSAVRLARQQHPTAASAAGLLLDVDALELDVVRQAPRGELGQHALDGAPAPGAGVDEIGLGLERQQPDHLASVLGL